MKRYILLFIYWVAMPAIAEITIIPDKLTASGYLYLNATESAAQGEKYLLNKQLSSIQLNLDWKPTNTAIVHSVFIYNPWPTPIASRFYFEQLYTEFKITPFWYTNVGRKWMPFGNYRNDLIYKPLTKALGQTNEDAIQLGFNDKYYASLAIYKPHTTIDSQQIPISYTMNLGVKEDYYDFGVSYINSIADTQLFRYNKGFGGFLNTKIDSEVPGFAGYLNWKYKKTNANLTYVSAITAFKADDLSYEQQGARPAAVSLQSGYEFTIINVPAKIIGFYDRSLEALALKLPEQRAGVGFNLFPYKYIDLQLEVYKDYAYAADKKASGLDEKVNGSGNISNTVALQVLFHF